MLPALKGVTVNGTQVVRESSPPRRRFGRYLGAVVLLLAAWLLIGLLRAETIARDYFAAIHGGGSTISNVQISAESPAIPPFWIVSINGEVKEPQMTSLGYTSAMILVVEPVTGWVFVFGAG
jgi:hypothetical protein